MATTATDIINRAVQRSALNNPDLVPPAQMLQYISLFERQAYARAAQVNPEYFGKETNTAARADNNAVWDIAATPGDVMALTRAEVVTITGAVSGVAVGDKVNLVTHRHSAIEVAPRAYLRGRRILQFASELGSSGANFVSVLKLYYSPIPTAVTTSSQALTIPDEWTMLVELPLARILAVRDRRLDETASIDDELKMLRDMFDEAMISYDHGVRRSLIAMPGSVNVGRALAGGAGPAR